MKRLGAAFLAIVLLATCAEWPRHPKPHRARELRGLWVATVANLDWPSRRDLAPERQRAELTAILDRAAALHLNAIFLQVRPQADAIYPSELEPWSEYLTGTMGKAPDPPYDPLAFAVAEAHARGLELHAWFNPFRAHHPSAASPIAATHVARAHREWVRDYGSHLWLDPGEDGAQRATLAVIADVVRRYDVDGVHLDDYFYPYPESSLSFPDDPSWRRYEAGGGRMSRQEWRRDNINRFVHDLYVAVKEIKPAVEVGISPFGIWRPGHPRQIEGLDAYAEIYADSRLWLQKGWVDYLAPQLYWPIDRRAQSFPVLLRWWTDQDRKGRGIVAGVSVNRVATGRAGSVSAEEIGRQLDLVRRDDGAVGFILFSARTLMQDRGGVDAVLQRSIARSSG
jgi:uncharacterized lipoprotein YddW (UPF0748 family)